MVVVSRMYLQWVAAKLRAYGWSGVRGQPRHRHVAQHHSQGIGEIGGRDARPNALVESGVHRKGAGRKRRTDTNHELLHAMENLVEPTTRGDP